MMGGLRMHHLRDPPDLGDGAEGLPAEGAKGVATYGGQWGGRPRILCVYTYWALHTSTRGGVASFFFFGGPKGAPDMDGKMCGKHAHANKKELSSRGSTRLTHGAVRGSNPLI